MKPRNKKESTWQWRYRDGRRICVKSLKESRFNKRGMNKARRATDKTLLNESKGEIDE